MRRAISRFSIHLVLVWSASATVMGCSDDLAVTSPLIEDGIQLYIRLDMNHHAVLLSTVSPYDTVRLVTTPRGANGEPWQPVGFSADQTDSLLQANPATFISKDSSRVRVSEDGLVRAVGVTSATGTVQIIATRQILNVTRADTTLVRVLQVATPPVIASFQVRPQDSLKIAINSALRIVATALDAGNNPIPNIVTYVRTQDSTILGVGSGSRKKTGWNTTSVTGQEPLPGSTRIMSEAYVYGHRVVDTVTITTGYPLSGSILVGKSISLVTPLMAVASGAVIQWNNATPRAMNVIFDDSLAVLPALIASQNSGGGNMYAIPGDDSNPINAQRVRYRRFVTPGRYSYRIEPYGFVGTVVVKDY